MTEAELRALQLQYEQLRRHQEMAIGKNPYANGTQIVQQPYPPYPTPQPQPKVTHSLVQVQLVGGDVVPFMISASPSLLAHSLKQMKETDFLYLFNDHESLAIRADKVVAVTMQPIAKGEE